MDAYPEDYVAHNLPFVLLSGLETETKDEPESVDYPLLRETGPKIYSDFPPVGGMTAEELRRTLLDEDAFQLPWNSRDEMDASLGVGYKVKSIGRVGCYVLFFFFFGVQLGVCPGGAAISAVYGLWSSPKTAGTFLD